MVDLVTVLLKPVRTIRFNIQQFHVLSAEYLRINSSLYNIKGLVFITEMESLLRGTTWVFK
jgi:hypothetical protein